MTHTTFQALGLAESLLAALSRADISVPTPIQAQAIPAVLKSRDVLGIAQTGTGKTAAFALPIIDALLRAGTRPKPRSTQVLILAPTRELASQIADNIRTFTAGTPIRHLVIFGGVSVRPQIDTARKGIDIVVATPGRLLDVIEQNALVLSDVRHVVLDEADRMLDMGFVRDVMRIVKLLPTERQSLLFSATMPANVEALAAKILKNPVRVEVTPEVVTVEKIEQSVFLVPQKAKKHWLIKHLAEPAFAKTVIFTRTKHGANRLAEDLDKAGIAALAIHGNKSQAARQKALAEFQTGRTRVLVATDIVARGIHVDDISHVVNYELPEEPESYVHRIGRTARAGKSGIAVTLCDPAERAKLRGVEKLTGLKFDVQRSEFTDASGFAEEPAREPRAPGGRGRGGERRDNGPNTRRAKPQAGEDRGQTGLRAERPSNGRPGRRRRGNANRNGARAVA